MPVRRLLPGGLSVAEAEELREVKRLLMTIRYYATWHALDLRELRALVADLTALVDGLEAT